MTISCFSSTPPKKIIAVGTKLRYVNLTIGEPIVRNRLAFELFFQVFDGLPKKPTLLRVTDGLIQFQCTHPNHRLLPSVHKDGKTLPSSLVDDRNFRLAVEPSGRENAGRYECFWECSWECFWNVTPTAPTEVFDVAIFEPELVITVDKWNSTGK